MGSSRFKGKALSNLQGKSMLYRLLERIRFSKNIKKIILATTNKKEDDVLEHFCSKNNITCYRGSSEDVLKRIKEAAVKNNLSTIVEILGDNPLVHSDLIDACISKYNDGNCDYVATATREYPHLTKNNYLFPIGIRVQVFNIETLLKCDKLSKEKKYREHSTMFITENPKIFNMKFVEAKNKFSSLNRPELTFAVNYKENLQLMNEIFLKNYDINKNFNINEAIKTFDKNINLSKLMFPTMNN